MPEWYPVDRTDQTTALYEKVKVWAARRNDVTIIGGLAVWELVTPQVRMRSRDIDIVLHTQQALQAFQTQFPAWGIKWRRKGRTTYKECIFIDAPPGPPVIDVFTTDADIGHSLFTMNRSDNVLPSLAGQGFLPRLTTLLSLKIRAIPDRSGADAEDKRAKDLLDVHRIVFHNLAGVPPQDLLVAAGLADREKAASNVPAAKKRMPAYAREYDEVRAWLRSK